MIDALKEIDEIAKTAGLQPEDLLHYGPYKAKISLKAVRRILEREPGKLILVSAITPTPAGEGKTTTSIGLTQGLRQVGANAVVALREPSLGPVFGIKGGATGGGASMVHPADDINLHFNGDLHAITAAHNLISASLDNAMHFDPANSPSPGTCYWKRVMDMNDRSLRDIVIGLGEKNGPPREDGFDITAASEIMAILCLSSGYGELKERIGRILLGTRTDGSAFRVSDLGVQNAAAALLKDALLPNLVQTSEGGPALIHGGPFANIAQGANSVLATNLALRMGEVAVTEAGFGFDLGAEKFFDIVSPYGGFAPDLVVLVATARALKMHGGVPKKDLNAPDPDAVRRGAENLVKHIENIRKFGVPPLVAINVFPSDSEGELAVIGEICAAQGVEYAVSDHFGHGGIGASELANRALDILKGSDAKGSPLYDWDSSVEEKIEKVAREIYGAEAVDFTSAAKKDIKAIVAGGYDKPAGMHRQDPIVAERQPQTPGPAKRLPGHREAHRHQRRRGLPGSPHRGHHAHARPSPHSLGPGHRYRRRRGDTGAELIRLGGVPGSVRPAVPAAVSASSRRTGFFAVVPFGAVRRPPARRLPRVFGEGEPSVQNATGLAGMAFAVQAAAVVLLVLVAAVETHSEP
jgi:formate--tetrahydrofolate ligase